MLCMVVVFGHSFVDRDGGGFYGMCINAYYPKITTELSHESNDSTEVKAST